MEIVIQQSAKAATRLVAELIAGELRTNPRLVLGLATGGTMETVYGMLVEMHKKEGLDFSKCRTFNLDEYVGLPPDNPCSYRHYMNHHLFDRVNIDKRNTRVPDGMAADLDAACREYEEAIGKAGGIDLQLLGIGRDGHIGFNEPLSALRSRTRATALSQATIEQNVRYFDGDRSRMPKRALTMGVGTILDSRRCVMLAVGKEKAGVIAGAVEGPVTAMISASALQMHPQCTVVLDGAAASGLKETEYYRWIFRNEPKWGKYHGPAALDS